MEKKQKTDKKNIDKEEKISYDDIAFENNEDAEDIISADIIKKLREKLKKCVEEKQEYLDGWQRAQADFANLRRRDEDAKFEFIKFARLSLIEELIPVLDSFNIALAHGNKDVKPIYDQLFFILKQNGLEELNPTEEVFDPKFHEAVGVVPTNESEKDHKILEVIQKGYILIGKIIRPAKVKIGEYHG